MSRKKVSHEEIIEKFVEEVSKKEPLICDKPGCGRNLLLTGYVENNGKKFCCPACAS